MTEPEIRTVVVERELPHRIEKLWRALTQPHLLEEWLMTSDFRPELGHKFELTRSPKPDVKVSIQCEVLSVEPMKALSYSWQAYGLDSVVSFTLTPTVNGTVLRMEQTGFRPDQQAAYHGARAGWRAMVDALEGLLETID